MKKYLKLYPKSFRWPFVAAYLIVILYFVNRPARGEYIVFGLDRTMGEGVNYIALSRWLLLMCTPLVLNGVYFEKITQLETFICVRMKKLSEFRILLLIGAILNSLLWAVCLFIGAVFKSSFKFALSQFVLSATNLAMWSAAEVILYLRFVRASWSGILSIGIVGGAYLLSEYIPILERFSPAIWGMLCRSKVYYKNGYQMLYMLLMNIFICVILAVICCSSGSKKIVRKRKS